MGQPFSVLEMLEDFGSGIAIGVGVLLAYFLIRYLARHRTGSR